MVVERLGQRSFALKPYFLTKFNRKYLINILKTYRNQFISERNPKNGSKHEIKSG